MPFKQRGESLRKSLARTSTVQKISDGSLGVRVHFGRWRTTSKRLQTNPRVLARRLIELFEFLIQGHRIRRMARGREQTRSLGGEHRETRELSAESRCEARVPATDSIEIGANRVTAHLLAMNVPLAPLQIDALFNRRKLNGDPTFQSTASISPPRPSRAAKRYFPGVSAGS
jgi:hypothetical protein